MEASDAEIDEARASAIQLEDELKSERESWRLEKMGLERQLSQCLDELNGLKAAVLPDESRTSGGSNSERDRSPRFQELTNLAADDAMFQMQVKELEDELQSAHAQHADRTLGLAHRLDLPALALEQSGWRVRGARSRLGRASAGRIRARPSQRRARSSDGASKSYVPLPRRTHGLMSASRSWRNCRTWRRAVR